MGCFGSEQGVHDDPFGSRAPACAGLLDRADLGAGELGVDEELERVGLLVGLHEAVQRGAAQPGQCDAGGVPQRVCAAVGHARRTASKKAQRLLANWETEMRKLVKVLPSEYRRVLAERANMPETAGVAEEPAPRHYQTWLPGRDDSLRAVSSS